MLRRFYFYIVLWGINCILASEIIDVLSENAVMHGMSTIEFSTVIDSDQSQFLIRRLADASHGNILRSCYEMKKGRERNKFCYPNLHVAGIGKCGTTALYDFFKEHNSVVVSHKNKEYCPGTYTNLYYDYLKEFSKSYGDPMNVVHLNGCVTTKKVLNLHRILAPHAAYIFLVRSMADRTWAAYNYFCSRQFYDLCPTKGWTIEGHYRDAVMFNELVKGANHPAAPVSSHYHCNEFKSFYTDIVHNFGNISGHSPLVISMEALSAAPEIQESQMQLIESYLARQILFKIALDKSHLRVINTGNSRGNAEDSSPLPPGSYHISNNRPMLLSTANFINSCWEECSTIVKLTGYPYNCTLVPF
jgi:hypothetical protein